MREGVVPVVPLEAREARLLSRLAATKECPMCSVNAYSHTLQTLSINLAISWSRFFDSGNLAFLLVETDTLRAPPSLLPFPRQALSDSRERSNRRCGTSI